MVMVSNQSKAEFWWLAGAFPGRVGHLYGPGGERGPWDFMPYALDNGAWPAFVKNLHWDEPAWHTLLNWAKNSGQAPLWVAVPDVVADRERTIEKWPIYSACVREYGFRPAFVLQDGMTFEDVPDADCMLFIGGSTGWKLAAIEPWCAKFPDRIHVGRVNGPVRLDICYRAGAVSVDGTGWFHAEQCRQLREFVERTSRLERRAA